MYNEHPSATYLVDALREIADGRVTLGSIRTHARRAVRHFDADLSAGRVPIIVDRDTRDAVEAAEATLVGPWWRQLHRIVDAYAAATRDTPRSGT